MSATSTPFTLQPELPPPSLDDLLSHELACRHQHAQLTRALDEAQRQLTAVKATRSPFFILQSSDARREARLSQAEAEAAVGQSQQALARLAQLESVLKSFIAYRLEIYLRNTQKDYVQSLLARRQPADWQRWRLWFEHYAHLFLNALTVLQATASGIPSGQTLGAQSQAADLLAQAAESARHIEQEITFFNKVADAESRLHGPGGHALYRQLALDWMEAVKSLRDSNAQTGPHLIAQYIGQFTDIARHISHALHNECPKPVEPAALETSTFHARYWAALSETLRPLLSPDRLAALARETERLLADGRIAELANMQEELRAVAAPRATSAPFAGTGKSAAPPNAPAKPVLQLRTRRPVTTAPFGNTPSPPGGT
jgi:hypothetical protein